jgi:hypothetical protein
VWPALRAMNKITAMLFSQALKSGAKTRILDGF